MRGTMLKILACLLVVTGVMFDAAEAAQRTKTRKVKGERPDMDKAYDLEDIMESPKEYIEREVIFYCRFATTANLFKSINTRFNVNQHVNIAVWPEKAALWDSKERKNVLPTLYVSKNDPDNLEMIKDLRKYEVLAITGRVLNVYAGYPWIQVTKIERIEKPSETLCEQFIEHMQAGNEALKAEHGGAAARHYEQAMEFGIPLEFRARAYEQLARAYLLDNRLDRALSNLRQAVELDRADPVLHLALADVALRMGEANEALAHCKLALDRSGKYPQVYGIRAEAYSLLCDFGKAFADLNTAAGTPGITAREKSMISVRRARIYNRSSRYADAARVYAQVSEPSEPLAGESWLHNEIGLFYERLYLESDDARYLDSAYAAFEEAARLSRLDPALYYNMAEVEYRRQRLAETPDWGKVSAIIKKIYEIEPDFAAARILEGRVLFFEGKMEEAEYRYQSVANQIGQDPTALLSLGEAYMELGYYSEAAATVSRAIRMQPWNCRVQALGRFLVDTAEQMSSAESEYHDAWRNEAMREKRFDGRKAAPSTPSAPAPTPAPGGVREQPPVVEAKPTYKEAAATRGARNVRPASERPQPRSIARAPESRPAAPAAPAAPKLRPESEPVPANSIAAAGSRGENYSFDASKMTRPRASGGSSGQSLGLTSTGLIDHGSSGRQPQDIQASARPTMPGPWKRSQNQNQSQNRYPRTHVQLEGKDEPVQYRQRNGEQAVPQQPTAGSLRPAPEHSTSVEPLDLGFTPSGEDLLEHNNADEYEYEEFNSEFGKDYEWERGGQSRTREAQLDEDGFLKFGMIEGVGSAYASLPIQEDQILEAEGGARIPPVFSFKSDDSPVLIADVQSPGPGERKMPVRNANVYRRLSSVRQPAEIIEKEPITPRLSGDTAVMAPPAGGAVRRAEVRLPSSARGVGMSSDYAQGR